MANIITLTEQQTERYEEFCNLLQTIKELSDQAADIRAEIDQQVYDSQTPDDEPVVFIVKDKLIEFSVVTKSFKFAYDITKYIEETQAYSTLSVSSTVAKKDLSKEQLDKYFSIENGSRRLKIK